MVVWCCVYLIVALVGVVELFVCALLFWFWLLLCFAFVVCFVACFVVLGLFWVYYYDVSAFVVLLIVLVGVLLCCLFTLRFCFASCDWFVKLRCVDFVLGLLGLVDFADCCSLLVYWLLDGCFKVFVGLNILCALVSWLFVGLLLVVVFTAILVVCWLVGLFLFSIVLLLFCGF